MKWKRDKEIAEIVIIAVLYLLGIAIWLSMNRTFLEEILQTWTLWNMISVIVGGFCVLCAIICGIREAHKNYLWRIEQRVEARKMLLKEERGKRKQVRQKYEKLLEEERGKRKQVRQKYEKLLEEKKKE